MSELLKRVHTYISIYRQSAYYFELREADPNKPYKSAKQTVITEKPALSLRNRRHMTYTTGENITAPDATTSADDFKWLEKTFLYAEGRDRSCFFFVKNCSFYESFTEALDRGEVPVGCLIVYEKQEIGKGSNNSNEGSGHEFTKERILFFRF